MRVYKIVLLFCPLMRGVENVIFKGGLFFWGGRMKLFFFLVAHCFCYPIGGSKVGENI